MTIADSRVVRRAGIDRMFDSQWTNVVNHDDGYHGWEDDDAIAHAVRMTEDYMAANFTKERDSLQSRLDAVTELANTWEATGAVPHDVADDYEAGQRMAFSAASVELRAALAAQPAPVRLRLIYPDGLVQFAPAETKPGFFEGQGCAVIPIYSEEHLAAEVRANSRRYAPEQPAPGVGVPNIGVGVDVSEGGVAVTVVHREGALDTVIYSEIHPLATRPAESVAQGGEGGIVSEESVQSAYCVADAYIDSKGGDVSTLDDGHWGEMLRLVLENDRKEFAP